MNYLNAKQFSENWGISVRRIIKLCKDGRIDGAIKNGRQWLIPENTLKPSDKRAMTEYNNQKKIYEKLESKVKSDFAINAFAPAFLNASIISGF